MKQLQNTRNEGRKNNIEVGMVITLALLVSYFLFDWLPGVKIAIIVLLITIISPVLLTPFSRLWMSVAKVLEKVSSSLILVLIFFGVVTPIAYLRRLITKTDILHLRKFKKESKSVLIKTNFTYQANHLEKQF